MRTLARHCFAILVSLASLPVVTVAQQGPIYPTYGAHNPPSASPCAEPNCDFKRGPNEPTDPEFPEYWSSHWIMYRVFKKFADYPPPYAGGPPKELKEGEDYEVSYGATYYDSTWRGTTGEGAMMEHYDKRCLPIFPISNHYTCSFISLGDVAYFITYDEDRPKDMPPVCLFSPLNHPPRRDFIKHLPYAVGDSARLDMLAQGYSFWVDADSGKMTQVGVYPDQTTHGGIMFGYAFEALRRPDAAVPDAPPYRHPQSFYFSGAYSVKNPTSVPAAPIVTQNYTDFAMVRPDPVKTWDQVKDIDWRRLPACQLFNPPTPKAALESAEASGMRTWTDIGRRKR